MLTLHYYRGNASLTPHFLLQEIGAPFELALVDRTVDAQRSEAYLRLNPNGRIPTLVESGLDGGGEVVVYETVATVLHLVDRFPEAKLAPAVGTKERSLFYRWIGHLASSVQPEMRPYFYPDQHVEDPAHADAMKRAAEKRLTALFTRIDAQLGVGPYLLGDTYSAADPYLLMLVRWGRGWNQPPRDLPNIARHCERLLARPAIQRTFAREGIAAPFV